MSSHKNHIVPDIYLKPGEAVISNRAEIVSTVLGSCISITMFSLRQKMGAICHNLLPKCKEKSVCNDNCHEAFRYVECTIRRMLDEFISRGINQNEIEVKIFGGADMFKLTAVKKSSVTVGRQNIDTALKILGDFGLKIAASDTGGTHGRKIVFCTQTGTVLLKRLEKAELNTYDNE